MLMVLKNIGETVKRMFKKSCYDSGAVNRVSSHLESVEGLGECEKHSCFDNLNMSGSVTINQEELNSNKKF